VIETGTETEETATEIDVTIEDMVVVMDTKVDEEADDTVPLTTLNTA